MSSTRIAISRALGLILLTCTLATISQAEITVGAAVSFSDVLPELVTDFKKTTNVESRTTFSASNTIARQIESGAPIDVFISADLQTISSLQEKGLIRFVTGKPVARNQLVIAVPKNSTLRIEQPEDILRASKIALAESSAVPAGMYAKAWLESENLWHETKKRSVPFANVRASLQAVETGNVDAAIVYLTDARSSKTVRIAYRISSQAPHAPAYYAAIAAATKHPDEAKHFITYLTSPSAKKILQKHFFLTGKTDPIPPSD